MYEEGPAGDEGVGLCMGLGAICAHKCLSSLLMGEYGQ